MTEQLKLPSDVVETNWKELGIEYETIGTPKEEREYISPNTVSDETIEKIKSIDLQQRFRARAQKVREILNA
ncbi:hypothetical protein IJH15_01200 [Candidatus Saccharibacteria bacterium]|nr:hypothetical protein [Candidatus Saccharibacteria bacterium]